MILNVYVSKYLIGIIWAIIAMRFWLNQILTNK